MRLWFVAAFAIICWGSFPGTGRAIATATVAVGGDLVVDDRPVLLATKAGELPRAGSRGSAASGAGPAVQGKPRRLPDPTAQPRGSLPHGEAGKGPAAPAPEKERRGLAEPDEDAWGDEWFDEVASPAAPDAEIRVEPGEAGGVPNERPPSLKRILLQPIHGPADLEAVWRQRRAALLRQDPVKAGKEEATLAALQRELDLPELHLFALAAAKESRHLEAAAPTQAEALAKFAASLGPSLPEVHLQRLRARLATAPLDIAGSFTIVADWMKAWVGDSRSVRLAGHDLGLAAAWGFGISGLILLIGWSAGHLRPALHDFHHLQRYLPSRFQSGAIFVFLLGFPLALGLGPFWSLLLLFAAIGPWLSNGRRIVLWGWLALLACLPLASAEWAKRVAWDGTHAAAVHEIERAGNLADIGAWKEASRSSEVAPQTLFATARGLKRLGRIDEARHLYQQALLARPRWAEALVNLGNIDFLEGQHLAAEKNWAEAVRLDAGLAPAYFNLSRLHYERADIIAGQAARQRAVELSPSLVERYADENPSQSPANRYLLDATLSDADLVALASIPDEADRLRAEVGQWLFGSLPLQWATGAAAALLLLLMGLWAAAPGGKQKKSDGCQSCGNTICLLCDENGQPGLCGPCVHVYSKKVLVDPRARERKAAQVRAFRSRRRLASILGACLWAGPAFAGRLWVGVPLLILCWLLLSLIGAPAWVRGVDAFLPFGFRLAVFAPPLVALSIWSARDIRRNG